MIRHTVHYSGRVQGVGFRYTVARIAQRHTVAGCVQNLPDGRVCLIAEGAKEDVADFIDAVNQQLSRYIDSHDTEESQATSQFGQPDQPDTFAIRY